MAETTSYSLQDKMRDAERAFANAGNYHRELDDIYRYFMPFRAPTVGRAGSRGQQSEGASRTQALYDGTGPSSAFAFVSNMKADWMPAFDNFFTLKNGPLYKLNPQISDDVKKQRTELLQAITDAAHGITANARATTTEEMFSDLFSGTGAMVLNKGDKRQPIEAFAVPVREMAMEAGPNGSLDRGRRFWRRNYKTRDIEPTWPNAKIPKNLGEAILKDRNADVEVTQYVYWDWRENRYCYSVWTTLDADVELWHEDGMLTSPWITPRMFVVPGESMGRGLAHLGLPFVKGVNKTRELSLRAAAFSLLGLWTRRHDGVFNPETARMVPGAMWKVASNGSGGLGKSIDRLDVPHNFDVSTIIIKDEREQIRRVLLDDELPELADRVRSPTEIAGRRRRYERNRGGATTRLAYELVLPFVQRTIDIMSQHGVLPGGLTVDQMVTEVTIAAPAAAVQRTDRVERMVSWVQIMAGLVGPQFAMLTAKIEELLPEIGRDLGVDEKFIRKKAEYESLKDIIETAVQQAAQSKSGAAPPQPQQQAPEVAPEQGYMNGGF